ncbi:MAG: cell division protein ZipA C-terminal FtsZ-binding domain-containing protein [Burkholderiaceae bacterium]
MSSLGLSLLILIVVAIGALAGYNFWLTRKPGPRTDELDTGFTAGSSTRQEPSFSAGAAEPYLQADSQAVESAAGHAQAYAEREPAQAPNETAPAKLPEWAESPEVPEAPLVPQARPSFEVPETDTANAAHGQADANPATAQWSPGVLPEAPAAPEAPDLSWQSESDVPPASQDPASQTSFEGSIEQAMRLQREADDLIESGQQDMPADQPDELRAQSSDSSVDSNKAVDDWSSARGLDEQSLNQGTESEPLGRTDTSDDQQAAEPTQGTAEQQTEPSLFDTKSPDTDSQTSGPGESIGQTQAAQAAQAAQAVQAVQPEAPAPGWSGIDADRQAANFVATVNIELNDPVAGGELLNLTSQLTHAGTKPVRVTAGNPPAVGRTLIRTEPIQPDSNYTLLRLEVLQVNRHGPLSDVEYSGFVTAADAIGESLGVLVNPPDMNVVLIRSRVLDAEVASLDAQVAVNVETEDPIASAQFIELANKTGLTPLSPSEAGDDPAVFVARDDGGHVIYSAELKPAENPNRIVLMLDVPSVPKELQPVRKMVEGAWAFAQALNGNMIDDNGRFIDNALFERIESQIETHYQALLAAGVPAGSDLARQVYNPV